MQIQIRADSVEIEGYVNAVERKSKTLWSRMGAFIERICKGAFGKALKRNDNVRILLNHNPNRDLGGQKDGNLELEEDNIGLHARAVITDEDVVKKARKGQLRGWSFGFKDREVELKQDEDGLPLRDVRDLELIEVSLLDNTKTPAYDGTLINVRSEESILFGDIFEDEIQVREEETREEAEVKEVPKQPEAEEKINYDEWENLINDMKS